ncbi:MAG TPA: hypothetical protein VJO72_06050, partial [Candidatus Dormibacteraeota bacterium]|nr:hypothetical protein [Candidatus Dormibacteraeota bacterium]
MWGHPLRRHSLLGHRLLRICRIARLGLAWIGLRRVGLALWLRAGVRGTLVGRGGVAGLLRVAALPPGGSRWHAGLTSRRPALRGSRGGRAGILARRPLLRPG